MSILASCLQGVAAQHRIWIPPPITPPSTEPVSIWELDETGGAVFADDGLADVPIDQAGTWANLTTGSLVEGGSGTSAFTDGAGYATLPAGQPAHDLAALTIGLYYQRCAAASKHTLLACGDGSQAGDFSLEVLTNGRLRGWHVGQDGALRYLEGTNGIVGTNLAVDTAHRVELSLGPLGARVYLDGAELAAAAIPANTNAWNNARIKYLGRWTDGSQSPAVGVFDRLRLWEHQLSGAEISGLEDAVAITPPAGPPVSIWELDETGGAVFADDGLANVPIDQVGTWADLTTGSLVEGGGGTSAFTDGAGYATLPAGQPAHDLAALTLSVYYQRGSAAAKQVLLAAGEGSQAGDFSVEVLADGKLRGWHVGQDGVLRFFEGGGGIVGTNLAVDTAHRVELSLGPLGARVYLDGAELAAAAIAANTNAWNNARVKYLGRWTDGSQSPAVGVFDRLRLWERQLSGAEIAGLEDAGAITPPGGPPAAEEVVPTGFSPVVTTHKNLGTITAEQVITVSGSPLIDCRGTLVVQQRPPPPNDRSPYLPNRGFRVDADIEHGCLFGLAVRGDVDFDVDIYPLSYPHPNSSGAVFLGRSAGASMLFNFNLIEGCRISNTADMFRFTFHNPRGDHNTIKGCWFSNGSSDGVENDQIRSNNVVECLFDGSGPSCISSDNDATVPSGTEVAIEDTLIRMRPMLWQNPPSPGLSPGYGPALKVGRAGNNVPYHVRRCVFAFQQASNQAGITGEPTGNPFRRLLGSGTIGTWEDVTICWLGAGSYPWETDNSAHYRGSNGAKFYAGSTFLTGATARSYWTSARAAFIATWKAKYPGTVVLGSPWDDGFPLP